MPPVPGTLQSTGNLDLGEVVDELIHRETETLGKEALAVDRDSVVLADSVLKWTVVPVIIVGFGKKAAIILVTAPHQPGVTFYLP